MLIGVERCELQITFHLGIDKQGLGIHQLRWAAFHPSIPLACVLAFRYSIEDETKPQHSRPKSTRDFIAKMKTIEYQS